MNLNANPDAPKWILIDPVTIKARRSSLFYMMCRSLVRFREPGHNRCVTDIYRHQRLAGRDGRVVRAEQVQSPPGRLPRDWGYRSVHFRPKWRTTGRQVGFIRPVDRRAIRHAFPGQSRRRKRRRARNPNSATWTGERL